MMQYVTEQGRTVICDAVFARTVIQAQRSFANRMIFSTPKGKPVKVSRTGRESLGFLSVEHVEAMNAVNLKIYVILRFGVPAAPLLEQAADAIRRETKDVTGFDVNRINFFVTGIKAKKLVRHNMEYIY